MAPSNEVKAYASVPFPAQPTALSTLPVDQVTPGDLLVSRTTGPTGVVSDRRRTLVVAGVPVATVSGDPAQLTPLSTTSAEGMPVVEILAAIAAQHPSGVLILEERPPLPRGFAFAVVQGRVIGARGPGALDQLEAWMAELQRRFPERLQDGAPTSDAWVRAARTFVAERVLDHLDLAQQPGARMTFLRGDVEWVGPRLVPQQGPALEPLLLEHARRWDETKAIEARLGDLTRVVVPLSPPPDSPRSPREGPEASQSNEWDFLDEPDPAALEEWDDARTLFSLCEQHPRADELIEHAMLGRFRGLAALNALLRRRHVRLVWETELPNRSSRGQVIELRAGTLRPAATEPGAPSPVPETGDRRPSPSGPVPREDASESGPRAIDTGYSMVTRSKERVVERVGARRVTAAPGAQIPRGRRNRGSGR